MSLMKGTSFPLQRIAESRPTSLLPFLYQTRTLLSSLHAESRSLKLPIRHQEGRFFSKSQVAPFYGRAAKPGSGFRQHGNSRSRTALVERSSDTEQSYDIDRRTSNFSSSSEEWPWSSRSPQHTSQRPHQNQSEPFIEHGRQRDTTLTASEQAAFDQIFEEISTNSQKNEEDEDLEQDGAFAEDRDLPGSPRDQLATIFEEALALMNTQTSPLPKDTSETHTRLHNDSYANAFKRLNLKPALGSDEEAQGHLKQASDDHRHLVDSLLVAARDDREIWKILEDEVFSLMSQLNIQVKHEEKIRTKESDKQRKTTRLSSAAIESKALNSTTILFILQTNYAHHTLQALRLFRKLKLSSSYALALLPRLKSLGPISYVLGVSTPFYNELLFQKWIQYSDVPGLVELMQEMVNQGISPDLVTMEFLRSVDRSRKRDMYGLNGAAKKHWWSLRPVKDGWTKVKSFYDRFKEEVGNKTILDMEALKEERLRRMVNPPIREPVRAKPGPIEGGRLRKVVLGFDDLKPRYIASDRPARGLAFKSVKFPPVARWTPSSSSPSTPSSIAADLRDENPTRSTTASSTDDIHGEGEGRRYDPNVGSKTGTAARTLPRSTLKDWE